LLAVNRLVPLVVALLVAGVAPATAQAAHGASFWVSPHGSDANPGSRGRPFATPARARDAVRGVPRAARRGVRVNLLGGVYRLGSPLRLDARDSGGAGGDVVWRAAQGARPVISGAVAVAGWKLYDRERNIYRARVRAPRAAVVRTRQLYVDGRRAVRARSAPNPEGFERTAAGYTAPDDALAHWRNPRAIELVTDTQWKSMRCPVAAVDGREITMRQPCWTNVNVFPSLWSFQLLTSIENAYELLDEPGEWYLDEPGRWLYYMPRSGQRMSRARVELPVLQQLVDGRGTLAHPIRHIRFEGIAFEYATWLGPSGPNGYAADQGGFHLVGPGHEPNQVGHDPDTTRTPGNVRFRFARDLQFRDDAFVHLGAVGLDLDTGSQRNAVVGNRFVDTSAAAIQVGGVEKVDHHPPHAGEATRDNRIADNVVRHSGREYSDAPGIALGYTTRSTVSHNDIADVPWAGIALGWGWGLVDPGRYLGLPGAEQMIESQIQRWGVYDTPTTSNGNRILHNRIQRFLTKLWDGGAIYTVGRQGTSLRSGELIEGNVASGKRAAAGGNVFYTDGGSRYITLRANVSLNNPPGTMDFGPCLASGTDLFPLCSLTGVVPYGSDRGGCRPYGDIAFVSNDFEHPHFYTDACPYPPYPIDVDDRTNQTIAGPQDVPPQILSKAGLQPPYRHLLR
jgi:hypothetical protein